MQYSITQWNRYLHDDAGVKTLEYLYGGGVLKQQSRYTAALEKYRALFGETDVALVTAPGRAEIGGNHTDHQNGCVLAASVNLDILCVVSPNRENTIRIHSEGHAPDIIDISDTSPRDDEKNRSASLIRGIAAWFNNNGYKTGGFCAYTVNNVMAGSGLSSSASFEVAVGCILNLLYNDNKIGSVDIAVAGQFAENNYFGKPSGLLDQMASSSGGVIEVDFTRPRDVKPVPFDLAKEGYALCITDTKGSHSDLTECYAAIPTEMQSVAKFFGKSVLREVPENDFYEAIPEVRKITGDRAVLRAMHFYNDNNRVLQQAQALRNGDFSAFLGLVRESGLSSQNLLQNIYCDHKTQGISIALALSGKYLDPIGGVCRVQGGGFAGTIQAYVPVDAVKGYRQTMEKVFGSGSCHVIGIRPVGGYAFEQ